MTSQKQIQILNKPNKLTFIVILLILFQNVNAQNFCNFSKISVDSLKYKVTNFIKDNPIDDSCKLDLIGYFSDRYIQTGKRKYIEFIDSIWKHGDGYISEYLELVSSNLFSNKFEKWFKYVYENRFENRGYNSIYQLFIQGMVVYGYSDYLSDNDKMAKEFAQKKINTELASQKYTSEQKRYLKKLFDKADFSR